MLLLPLFPASWRARLSGFVVPVAMLGFVVIYGLFFPVTKMALTQLDSASLAFLRMMGAGLLVAVLEFTFLRTRIHGVRDWLLVAGCGLLSVFWLQLMAAVCANLTTAFHATLIMSTVPLQTAVMGWLVLRQPLWFQQLLGIGLGLFGVAMLLGQKAAGVPLPDTLLQGDALIAINSLLMSGYVLTSKQLVQRYAPFSIIAYASMIAGGLSFLLVTLDSLLLPLPVVPSWAHLLQAMGGLNTQGWLLLAYLTVLAGIVGYWLNNVAMTRAPASTVASYILLQPLVAALAGFFLFAEPFTAGMALAAALTLAGVWLVTHPLRRWAYARLLVRVTRWAPALLLASMGPARPLVKWLPLFRV